MEYRKKSLTSGFLRLTARLAVIVPFAALLYGPSPALAASLDLGSADNFSVLAGGAVTCTDSVVAGDVGAGTVVTQTRCTISGTVHQADAVAQQAYTDFVSAYQALALMPCGTILTGTLAGITLAPGVYCFDAAATLTGTLTLNGPADGAWLFKIGAALTGTNFTVVMAGGGQACNVNWRTGAAATLTTSNFRGTVLAGADITVTGGTLNGDVMAGGAGSPSAPTGAVTLTNAVIAGCAATTPSKPPSCDQDDEDDDNHHNHHKHHKHHKHQKDHDKNGWHYGDDDKD
jgi:Ice-binding-like